jgi:hypothetical protein
MWLEDKREGEPERDWEYWGLSASAPLVVHWLEWSPDFSFYSFVVLPQPEKKCSQR